MYEVVKSLPEQSTIKEDRKYRNDPYNVVMEGVKQAFYCKHVISLIPVDISYSIGPITHEVTVD